MRVALVAVGTGQFVWYQAAGSFVWMLVGGLLVGLLVAWVMIKLHHYLPTDEKIDVVFTLITPYIMYIAAEEVGASGVIAVVSGGLYLSSRNILFMDSSSRLSGWNFWHNFVFLLNGLVFLLIGLDLPEVVAGMREGGMSLVHGDVVWSLDLGGADLHPYGMQLWCGHDHALYAEVHQGG